MKRFLAFYTMDGHQQGGFHDFVGDFNHLNEAIEDLENRQLEKNRHDDLVSDCHLHKYYRQENCNPDWRGTWGQVFDTETKQVVFEFQDGEIVIGENHLS